MSAARHSGKAAYLARMSGPVKVLIAGCSRPRARLSRRWWRRLTLRLVRTRLLRDQCESQYRMVRQFLCGKTFAKFHAGDSSHDLTDKMPLVHCVITRLCSGFPPGRLHRSFSVLSSQSNTSSRVIGSPIPIRLRYGRKLANSHMFFAMLSKLCQYVLTEHQRRVNLDQQVIRRSTPSSSSSSTRRSRSCRAAMELHRSQQLNPTDRQQALRPT